MPDSPTPAREALARLKDGNQRFVERLEQRGSGAADARQVELVQTQYPIAIVLGCSDSRVPAEIVFDQGIGDLFVIRVAGNIVAPSLIASAEFAATAFGTRLVVVLGHSECGAVTAALAEVTGSGGAYSEMLHAIMSRIRPAIEGIDAPDAHAEHEDLLDLAVRTNVEASVEQLKAESRVLDRLSRDDGLQIVGAVYSLDSGVVEFLDRQADP